MMLMALIIWKHIKKNIIKNKISGCLQLGRLIRCICFVFMNHKSCTDCWIGTPADLVFESYIFMLKTRTFNVPHKQNLDMVDEIFVTSTYCVAPGELVILIHTVMSIIAQVIRKYFVKLKYKLLPVLYGCLLYLCAISQESSGHKSKHYST